MRAGRENARPFLVQEKGMQRGEQSPFRLGSRERLALAILLALLYLYLLLFVPLRTPIDVGLGDDRLFLEEARRILDGQIIYRDFFEFYFPGVDLFYALLFRIFGVRAWIPNLCLLALGMGLVWTGIVLSRKLVSGPSAILPGLLFLWISYRLYLDAVPHWYAILLIMIATAVLIEARSPMRLMLAGALTGLAACFAQHHGAFAAAGLAAFVLWEGRRDDDGWRQISRRELCLLVPFGSIVGLCVVYAVRQAGFNLFVSSTILFPLKYWSFLDVNRWSENTVTEIGSELLHHHLPQLRLMLLVILVPGIYLVAIAGYLRLATTTTSLNLDWRRIILLSTVGLAMFASIVNAAVFWRMAAVSLPAMVIAVWMVERGAGAKGMVALWAITLAFMIRDVRRAQTSWTTILDTPAGRVALVPDDPTSLYQWLALNTHPGEYVFEAAEWDIYFWFGLQNPTKLHRLYANGFTRPEQVADAIEDLEARKPRLIVASDDLDTATYPGATDHLGPARIYFHSHYRKLQTFVDNSTGRISVWERTDSVGGDSR
jgi:hypothetical protein